ncbi:KAP family NTPase [Fusobacterium nucleatum]|uniref:P-loop NTPase fold protein n=1 Tax=Fusobacterium nucleatum subsp. polymorphum TaxID=76857 RepID=UPI001EED98CD|nr:P-loop NTPase fold protein [Fusobacterium nucleatum]MCG6841081.1 KAP family NTPase [Fusobacterium nucleatum]
MFLSNDEIIKVMLEYIEEDKYKSAILINGEWGSGKTFFITEKLSKVIKNKIKNDGKYIYVSLYGVENVEELSNKLYSEICSETLVKLSGVEKEKIDAGIKLIPKLLYFTKFIPFIKNYKSIKKIMAPIIKEIAKIKKCVVVFDDIERCKIDIYELFGYINELVEHNEVKVILVANEEKIVYKKNKYNEIKEKLVGITVVYKPEFNLSYENIIDTYLKETNLKEYLKNEKQKTLILKEFYEKEQYNLRTLIYLITMYKKIFSLLEGIEFDKNYVEIHMENILKYSTYISLELKKKNKLENLEFPENKEIENIYFKDNSQKILYGYKFINNYFQTGYLNEEKIKKILLDEMRERKKIDEKVKANEKLSFNKLYGNWWKLEDEEVNNNFKLLKEELEENKYPPILYKDIIIILLQLEIEEFIDENETLEFIKLMKKNLELEETKRKYEKSYKHEIFEIVIEDSKVKEKYNNLIKDLLDTIDKNIQKEDGKSFLVENEWNEEFLSECSKLSNVFLVNKKFLFYENIEELMKKIVGVKSPYNVYCLIEGIRRIYSFSNVNEYYKNDIPNLELLINKLKIQIGETQKSSKTRTMALKELCNKLEDYLNKIKK